jgi:hypothetical protein
LEAAKKLATYKPGVLVMLKPRDRPHKTDTFAAAGLQPDGKPSYNEVHTATHHSFSRHWCTGETVVGLYYL